ncbi:MAG: metallophosphoesterase [Clostridiales bacterium]|nr:metallophosphoesterase [Clostridiales bacterium]
MLYVTGDCHGDLTKFNSRQIKKLKEDDTLIICGDFGFIWDGSDEEERTLEKLSRRKFMILFVDGAHENFDLLNNYKLTRYKGGYAHKIADNIYHLMRGEVYELEGKTVFAMGGGESYDREMRIEGESWWKDELPSREELTNGAEHLDELGGKVDLIITHEAPAKTKEFVRLSTNEYVKVTPLNNYLEQVTRNIAYKHWYFGSLHIDMQITANMTAIFQNVERIDLDEAVLAEIESDEIEVNEVES